MDESSNERREFSRVSTHPKAVIRTPEGVELTSGNLVDVSLGGALIEAPCDNLTAGSEILLSVLLGEGTGPEIQAMGTIVRADSGKIALNFIEIENPESFEHLRNLILYNSNNTEEVEDEFRSHTGITRETH